MKKKSKKDNYNTSFCDDIFLEDTATSLYNKNYFNINMNVIALQMIKGLSKNIKNDNDKSTWSLLFCDIDGLKLANDTLGHIVADEGIRKIAEIIKSCIRTNRKEKDHIIYNKRNIKFKNNIPIRFGGDEFIIILPNCTKEKAALIEKRIKDLINKNIKDTKNMTLSIGIADTTEITPPDQIDNPKTLNSFLNQLITLAEQRMYKDKNKEIRHLSYEEKKAILLKHLDRIGEAIGININNNEDLDLIINILNDTKEKNIQKTKR